MGKATRFLIVFGLLAGFLQCKAADEVHVLSKDLTIIGAKEFEITNQHRKDAKLKLSILGGTVSGIPPHSVEQPATNWHLNISDSTELYLSTSESDHNTTKYALEWFQDPAGEKQASLEREVCFHTDFNNASWYAAYEAEKHFPLDSTESIPKGVSFTVGSAEFGSIAEGLFINTDGFAINLYSLDAWFVRRAPNSGDPILCAAIDPAKLPYDSRKHFWAVRIHILASANIRKVHERMFQEPGWIGRPSGTDVHIRRTYPDDHLFQAPIWSTYSELGQALTQAKVLEYAQKIKDSGFPVAQLEIDDKWEAHYGDLSFDPAKFANASHLIDELHQLNLSVSIWVHPFVHQDSVAYQEAQPHLIQARAKNESALVSWWNGQGGIVDFSDYWSNTVYYIDRLRHFQTASKVDSFRFDAGELSWYGQDHRAFHDEITQESPNLMTYRYASVAAQFGGGVHVRSAFTNQNLPIFVRIQNPTSGWDNEALKTVIRNALTLSVGGYSFVLSDMVGSSGQQLPSEEIYIRWVQASTFLPAMQFSIPPWHYNDSTVKLVKKFIDLHAEHAPTLIALAAKVKDGEPIIRPMWYSAPDDVRSYSVADQFLVGEDLISAPVLETGVRERQVFIPSGTWLDQHGKELTGPGVFKVLAPLEELPYFKRKH